MEADRLSRLRSIVVNSPVKLRAAENALSTLRVWADVNVRVAVNDFLAFLVCADVNEIVAVNACCNAELPLTTPKL